MGKNKEKDKKKAPKAYSGIAAHKRQRKALIPPLMAVPGIKLSTWINDRLPEMLWCALMISELGRNRAVDIFRGTAALIRTLPPSKQSVEPTLSELASLESDVRGKFLSSICSNVEVRNALRPLLLFDNLPGRQYWADAIAEPSGQSDWERIQKAVAITLNHQSQEATDCRWLRVLFHVLSGKLKFPTEELVREILEYPNFGEPQKVRPSIRAQEGIIAQTSNSSSNWPELFWSQCLRDTACDLRHTMETDFSLRIPTTRAQVHKVREALAEHEKNSLTTTDIDAKHDAVFGIASYELAILDELLRLGNSTSIIGRIGLRTILESHLTLSYLKKRDEPDLWMAYRQYGSGQAKLAFLKLDESGGTVPSSVNMEVLRELANEDRWQEFLTIDLGHWAERDLRKVSEEVGSKGEYDRLYPWTSAFTHSNWAAVRNSCFDLCVNPVHRLHRRVRSGTAVLGDVVEDACELVDKTLAILDSTYPGFVARVTLSRSSSSSNSGGNPALNQTETEAAPLGVIQKEFFDILDEFFRRATGCSVSDFASLDSFSDRIKAEAHELGRRAPQAYVYAHEALGVFYERFGLHILSEARTLEGLKVVLGGSSRFGKSQFDSVRKMLLYADSILIPDPILPWIESQRQEERFRNVLLLETAFVLLHLKPLADANLSPPSILVVPSFERSLEERDPATQVEISRFVSRILSHFLGRAFDNLGDLQKYVVSNEAEFMRAVDENQLFVAPGGVVGQPLRKALEQYNEEIKHWRSESYQAAMAKVPKGLVLMNGLAERFAPHYHLLENAEGLSACPLLSLRAPWHYHSLISRFFEQRAVTEGELDQQATAALHTVSELKRRWLGNIPVLDLIQLRLDGENADFRTRLWLNVSELHEASSGALNRITRKFSDEIASLLAEHDAEIGAILRAYKSKNQDADVDSYVTPAASVLVTVSPDVRFGDPLSSGRKRIEPARSLVAFLALPASN